MGGRAKTESKTSSTQTTTNKTLNASASDIENGSVVQNSGDNANITATDHGAINRAGQLAESAFERSTDIAFEALRVGEESVRRVSANASGNAAAIERIAKSATTGGQSIVAESLVKIFQPFALGILVVAAVVIVAMIIRGKKRV